VDETDSYLHQRSLELNKERLLELFKMGVMNFHELLQLLRFYKAALDGIQLAAQLEQSYEGNLNT